MMVIFQLSIEADFRGKIDQVDRVIYCGSGDSMDIDQQLATNPSQPIHHAQITNINHFHLCLRYHCYLWCNFIYQVFWLPSFSMFFATGISVVWYTSHIYIIRKKTLKMKEVEISDK